MQFRIVQQVKFADVGDRRPPVHEDDPEEKADRAEEAARRPPVVADGSDDRAEAEGAGDADEQEQPKGRGMSARDFQESSSAFAAAFGQFIAPPEEVLNAFDAEVG